MKKESLGAWLAALLTTVGVAAKAAIVYENVSDQVISGVYSNTVQDCDGYFVIKGNSSVILRDLTITAYNATKDIVRGGLLEIRDHANVTIKLAGANHLYPQNRYCFCGAGIFVEAGSKLTICNLDDANPGTLTVTGGRWGAGIGGYCSACGDITINGGIINATATEQAAAIGAGDGRTQAAYFGTITINGGTVNASAGSLSAAIGGGYECRGGVVAINGGKITLSGAYGIGSGDGAVGSYTNFVTGGEIYCVSSPGFYPAPVNAKGEKYSFGVKINGVDVGNLTGPGWSYDLADRYVTLDDTRETTITGSNTEGKVMIALNGDVTATIRDLTLRSTIDDECCLWVDGTTRKGAKLLLKGTNTFTSCAGEGIVIAHKSLLTIDRASGVTDDDDAVLYATGANYYPGISVGYHENYHNSGYGAVAINGGHVVATGGKCAAGIGNGKNAFYSDSTNGVFNILISGGFVEAYGGSDAAGIGGGYDSLVGVISISGGTVKAQRGNRQSYSVDLNAVDISCGWHRNADWCTATYFTGGSIHCANFTSDSEIRPAPINAESERVWQVKVANLPEGAAAVTGLDGYGTNDLRTIDGELRLWLPDGEHWFTVNDESYYAEVNGASTIAKKQQKPEPGVTYRVSVPTVEHVKSVTVTTNGVEVPEMSTGVYIVVEGADVVVTCVAEGGYEFSNGATSMSITCKQISADFAISSDTIKTTRTKVVMGITVNGENIGNWSSQWGDWTYEDGDYSTLTLNRASEYAIEHNGTNELFGIVGENAKRIILRPASERSGFAALLDLRVVSATNAELVITGGTIVKLAYAGCAALTITGGSMAELPIQLKVAPSNGYERVWCLTVPCAGKEPIIDGLGTYGLDGVVPVAGKLHLWLPSGNYDFTVDGKRMCATIKNADATAWEYIEPFAKAVYEVADRTLSFCVNTNSPTTTAERYVWTNLNEAAWSGESEPNARQATNVILEASFAQYQPTSTRQWFANLSAVEKLDLTALDLSSVTDVREMFAGASALKTIYVTDRIAITNCTAAMAEGMFDTCSALQGEKGTAFDESIHGDRSTQWRYAQVDGEDFYDSGNTTGFFSRKRAPITVTVPTELPTNTVAVAVYENGKLKGSTGGVYETLSGFAFSVVYTAADGYQFPSGTNTYEFAYPSLVEDVTVDVAQLPPRQVKPARPIGVVNGSTLTLYYDNLEHQSAGNMVYVDATWGGWIPASIAEGQLSPIDTLTIDESFAAARLASTEKLFFGLANVTTVSGLNYLNTSAVTNFNYMFAGMAKVAALTVDERFITRAAVSSTCMFEGCSLLTGACGSTIIQTGTDAKAALVDFGVDRPGLFTALTPYVVSVKYVDGEFVPFHELTEALENVNTGAVVKLLVERAEPTTVTAVCDFTFDANGKTTGGLIAQVGENATLTLTNAPANALAELIGSGSRLALAGSLPDGDLYLSVSYPERRVDDIVLTNAWGVIPPASKVRICQAGYAAFDSDVGIRIESAWSRPFVLIEGTTGSEAFTAYESANEAIGGDAAVRLGLLDYVNDSLPFETNVVVSALTIPEGKTVALSTALRHSPDGTNTEWSVAVAPTTSTLRGSVAIEGTLELGNVMIDGAIKLGTNGVLKVGEEFAITNGYVYITIEDTSDVSSVKVTSDVWTPAQLKAHCRVTNAGWTFLPTEGGLKVKKVDDFVARIDGTYFESFDSAWTAAQNGGTIALLSYTNTVTQTHTDEVATQVGSLALASERRIVLKSARRTTTENSMYSWDDEPLVPTTLNLDGVALQLARDAELIISNLNVVGTIALSGDGLIDTRGYVGSPIKVSLGRGSTTLVNRAIAKGSVSQFELVNSDGFLEDRNGYVFWKVDVFSWSYSQTGNGKGQLNINDGGAVKTIDVESTSGSFTYTYVRDAGMGTVEMSGYLVYLDYDRLVVRLPSVKTEYLRSNKSWQTISDGAAFPSDWNVDDNGNLSFRFNGNDVRTVAGIASKPYQREVFEEEMSQKIDDEVKERERKGTHVGGLIGAVAGGVAGGAALGGIVAFFNAGGGAVVGGAPAVMGVGALANIVGANPLDVGGDPNPQELEHGDEPGHDEPHDPEEEVDPEPEVDPAEQSRWRENLEKVWDKVGKVMDTYSAVRACLDIFDALTKPIEYKAWPYFSDSFQRVHGYAADDNDPKYPIHWFFSTSIHSSQLPNGEVDITAETTFADFVISEAGGSGFAEGSGYGSFKDSMTAFARLITIVDAIRKELKPGSAAIAIFSEVAALFKNAKARLEARGYFDPPRNTPIILQGATKYNVNAMEFGTKSKTPNSPRTAPIFELQSGARLRLADCSMQNYTFDTANGLIHVSAGAELILHNFKLADNTSYSGSSPIVVEAGGKVIVTGSTTLSGIDCSKGTISIETGDYRSSKSLAGNLTGDVYIDGRTKVGSSICTNAMSAATGWEHLHSRRYGRWIEPTVSGSSVVWSYRSGAIEQLRPGFDPSKPLTIAVSNEVATVYVSGAITNTFSGFSYGLIKSTSVNGQYSPVDGASFDATTDGEREFDFAAPLDGDTGFFRIKVEN